MGTKNTGDFRSKRVLVITASILVIFSIVIVLVYQSHMDDDISDRLAIFPTLEVQYKQLSDSIDRTTNDKLLKTDSDEQLQLMRRLYRGCINGGFSKTYGANRSYQDVLADYEKTFLQLGWKEGADKDYRGYYTNFSKIIVNVIDPSNPDYPKGAEKYQTVYHVFFQYADPAIELCQG